MWQVPLTPIDRLIAFLVRAQALPGVGYLIRMVLLLRGTDIAPRAVTEAGGLRLPHTGIGVVVHWKARIGRDVTLYQGVTVGRADVWRPEADGFAIAVSDGAIIGANAVIISGQQSVVIGEGAVIGANSVVTQSVPAGEIWAGAPARKVGTR